MMAMRYGSFGAGKYHAAMTAPHCRIAPTDMLGGRGVTAGLDIVCSVLKGGI